MGADEVSPSLEEAMFKTTVCPGCGAVFKSWSQYITHGRYAKDCNAEMRFWARVNKNTPSGCWIWVGCVDKWGYGDLSYKGKHIQAHRLAWRLLESDPGEMDVLHKCNNPPCCNPDHLYLGTDLENARDRLAVGTQHYPVGKLTAEQVLEIRRRLVWIHGKKTNAKELAAEFGVRPGTILKVWHGDSWKFL